MEAEWRETAPPGSNLAGDGRWERREESAEGETKKEPWGLKEMKRGEEGERGELESNKTRRGGAEQDTVSLSSSKNRD